MTQTQTFLRPADACDFLGISRSTLHRLYETDATFPRKLRFSARCVGWKKAQLENWLNQKLEGSRHD